MFEFTTKRTYWSDLDNKYVRQQLERTNREMICLKHIQDSWLLARMGPVSGKTILDIGGGFARVLRTLDGNERWNLEKLSGAGRSVRDKKLVMPAGIRLAEGHMGSSHHVLEDDYFDICYSISVMEHIPADAVEGFWQDHARVLKRGGVGYHAVDFYLGDDPVEVNETRLDNYLTGIRRAGLEFVMEPNIERPAVFRATFATNPDLTMKHWNAISPALRQRRLKSQSVNLGIMIVKP